MQSDERLTVEWIDRNGKTWDLTAGTEGVLLDVGQSDFTLSPIEHTYVRGGTQWAGAQVRRAEPSLKLLVADEKTGTEYYRLADEWWSEANSPFDTGVLRVTRPDGEIRELVCRLRDTPGTVYPYDPGSGIDENPGEAWLLTSPDSYWSGPEQSVRFASNAVAGAGTPFYGPSGKGWPLYISSASAAKDLFISNNGQGPVWLTWTLVGPMSTVRFGVEGGLLAYSGSIPAGEQVIVSTKPGNRFAVEAGSGDNRYSKLSGTYAPMPVGDRLPLTIIAEGMTTQSAVIVTAREQFARPF